MGWDDTKQDDCSDAICKLTASEYNALVTYVKGGGTLLKSLFDANTILKADSDDTPVALTIDEQRILGRITAGSITGLTAAQVRTLCDVPSTSEAVLDTLFDAYSILYADTDNTPAALTVAASRFVGRKAAGGIAALTVAESKTLLAIAIADLTDGGDIFKKDGTVAMTGDFDMANNSINKLYGIYGNADNASVFIHGGLTTPFSRIQLAGKDVSVYPGQITFKVPNAAKDGNVEPGWFEGCSDTPYLVLEYGLKVDIVAEETADAGVTIDSCLIKDGTAAHTEVTKTSEITFATTDQSAGKAFTITDFPKHGMIKKVKFRANMTAGQLTTVSALVNDGTGLAPADVSLTFDNKSGTFTNGDYLAIDNEIVKINDADPNTSPIVIVRAQKGTTASYLDDNAQITKLNNGFKLQLFMDSNKKPKEMILELSALMTAVGTTDAAILVTDKKIELSADLKNVDNNDMVRIADTVSEEALVQHNTGDVAIVAYDFVLYVYDSLAAHDTAKSVEKQCIYDISVPYKSGATTLYGTIQLEEASLAANKTVNIEIIADRYS